MGSFLLARRGGAAAQETTALDFPGAPSFPTADPSIRLVWSQNHSGTTVPPLIDGFTAVWVAWPRAMQDAYWSGFFHALNSTNGWGGGAADASDYRYCGMHPYPVPAEGGATRNLWEISYNLADLYDDNSGSANYSRITQYQRWFNQAMRASDEGAGVRYEYWFDVDTAGADLGPKLDTTGGPDTKSDPPVGDRAIIIGDAPWNPGAEIYNGRLRGWAFYNRALSDAEILDAFDDPTSVTGLWYLNLNPTVADVSDKSGNGNDPAWVGANRPDDWQEP